MNLVVGSSGFIGEAYTTFLGRSQARFLTLPSRDSLFQFMNSTTEFEMRKVGCIIWLAGKAFPSNVRSLSDPLAAQDFYSLSIFLDFLKSKFWNGRFVFLSTGGCLYQISNSPLSEESEVKPSNVYGLLKFEQELLIIRSGIHYIILRASNVFGQKRKITPGRDVISTWIQAFLSDEVCKVFGSLESYRDYINVMDLTNAISLATECKSENQIINIGSGITTSTKDLIQIFESATLGKIRFSYSNSRDFDRQGYLLDIARANTLMNWQPLQSKQNHIFDFVRSQIAQ